MKKPTITFVVLSLSVFISLMVLWSGRYFVPEIPQEETLATPLALPPEVLLVPVPGKPHVKKTKQEENIADEAETNLDPFSAWTEAIRNSRRGNDLLLAALFSVNDEEREGVLHDAYSQDPENVLLNYQILQFCLSVPLSTLCSLPIVDTLLQNDGDNLHTLIIVSVFQYELGDVDSAFVSLSSVQDARRVEDYTIRYREALDESNRFHGYDRSFATLTSIIGVESAIAVPHLRSIMSMCDEQVERGVSQWRSTCSAYGKTLAEKGSSLFDQRIGLAIQLQYSGLSKEEISNFRDPRKEKLNADIGTMRDLTSQLRAMDGENKIISDAQWETYLTIYRLEGEMAAILYLHQLALD